MDEADHAQQYQDRLTKAGIDQITGRNRATGDSLTHCEECGEHIPEGRRINQPGCTRCVGCQELYERGEL